MTEPERCVRWFRVSTDKQDEQNQEADVNRHIAAHGYEVARPDFRLHAKSASKGEQEPELAELLDDIRAGRYTVVVVAQSSRLDRRDDLDAQIAFAVSVRLAGGRVESVDEPDFGRGEIAGWLRTLISMESNAKLSRDTKANIRRGLDRVRENGALIGKPGWGFEISGPKYNRRMKPTAEAREYVPLVYQRIIATRSLAHTCRWLESEGVAPVGITKDREDGRGKSGKWWPRTLGKLIRNPVYMGIMCERDPATGNYGQTIYDWTTEDEPPLVDADTWTRANLALDKARKRKVGPVLRENRCALSGAARCYRCGGPMYRIMSGRGDGRIGYLRCSGLGPDRKSCGAPMVRLDAAEALADEVMGRLVHPVYEIAVLPGNGAELDAALAALDYERRQVALRGLSWADEDAERARIRREWELVSTTPRIPDRRMVRETGVTYGQRWAKLDVHGRAEWLRSGELTLYFTRDEVPARDVAASRHGVNLVLYWPSDEDEV
jgi:DNA invertase Pin-like site-specific DNA recombinase